VAAQRAVLTDMGVLDDPYAQRMLTPSLAAVVALVRRWPGPFRARSITLAGFAARVRWYDAQVTAAMDAGVTQVAIVGAGYDSRAWRLGRDGVRFFELDHEATQRDKRRRAPQPDPAGPAGPAGPTYVAADLAADSAAEALLAGGLDVALPAMFVLEGLTMYLDEPTVRRLLGDLAGATAGGSRLAVEFQPPRDAGSSRNRRQRTLQRLARIGSGETLRCLVHRPEAVELVRASGWNVTEAGGGPGRVRAMLGPSTGLPIDAVNPHGSYIAATHA
jgi:methyltransferase (TIGR00027 family)